MKEENDMFKRIQHSNRTPYLNYLTLPAGWEGSYTCSLPSAEAVSVRPNARPRM